MWRRVASLSPLTSAAGRCYSLSQAAYRFQILQSLATEMTNPEKRDTATSVKHEAPFITFVLALRYILSADFSLGGPGSGKGTQCEKIVETFGFKHLSAGDLLRREIVSNSEDGTMILDLIKEGKIVPSEVTVRLLQKEMESSENRRLLIDGFPRSEENRIAFERIIGAEPDVVLFFDCPEEEMVKRVLNRKQGRVDDNIETIKKRLKVFHASNLPVINYYKKRGKLYTINAVGSVDEISEQVRPIFASLEVGKIES